MVPSYGRSQVKHAHKHTQYKETVQISQRHYHSSLPFKYMTARFLKTGALHSHISTSRCASRKALHDSGARLKIQFFTVLTRPNKPANSLWFRKERVGTDKENLSRRNEESILCL